MLTGEYQKAQVLLTETTQCLALSLEIGTALASSNALQTILQSCAKAILTHLHVALACIWTMQLEDKTLVLQTCAGLDCNPARPHATLPIGMSAMDHIIRERRPYITDHAVDDPYISDKAWVTRTGMVAFAAYPLTVEDRLVGIIALFAREPFSDMGQAALTGITASMALSIDRLCIADALARSRDKIARMSRSLDRKQRELEAFTYMASHDLQQPLRHLTSFSSMLRRDLGDDLPARAAQDLAFISGAAEHMHALIRDLLLLSRTSQVMMQPEQVALDTCVDQALAALFHTRPRAPASIRREPLPTICGDRLLLTQVYRHLLENAIKFNRHPEPCIHLTAEPYNGQWILGVADNGSGIKPEHCEQIFMPFQRLQSHGPCEGTGIGLAICRKAIERHGGRIWVESQPGQGTQVKFTLGDMRQDEADFSP